VSERSEPTTERSPIRFIALGVLPIPTVQMSTTIETDDDPAERIERHLEDDESIAEFLDELVTVYETEGASLEEGYSE